MALAAKKSATYTEPTGNKEANINMRTTTEARDLIALAAKVRGITRTEFILQSALAQAHDALLDRRLLPLEKRKFDAFKKALDEPVPPNSQLKKLLNRTPIWEKDQ